MLGHRFCARAFSSCGKRGPLFIAVRGPLTVAASLVVEHRLQTRRLSSCGSRAQSLRSMWDLPRPGLEPVSPALAGRFSTTAPAGKPQNNILRQCLWRAKWMPRNPWRANYQVCKWGQGWGWSEDTGTAHAVAGTPASSPPSALLLVRAMVWGTVRWFPQGSARINIAPQPNPVTGSKIVGSWILCTHCHPNSSGWCYGLNCVLQKAMSGSKSLVSRNVSFFRNRVFPNWCDLIEQM